MKLRIKCFLLVIVFYLSICPAYASTTIGFSTTPSSSITGSCYDALNNGLVIAVSSTYTKTSSGYILDNQFTENMKVGGGGPTGILRSGTSDPEVLNGYYIAVPAASSGSVYTQIVQLTSISASGSYPWIFTFYGTVLSYGYMTVPDPVSYSYYGTLPSGTASAPLTVNHINGETVNIINPAVINGYTFSGWTNKDVTIIDGKYVMPNFAVNFIGTWIPNTDTAYTIEFYKED